MEVGDLVRYKPWRCLAIITQREDADGGHDPVFTLRLVGDTERLRITCWKDDLQRLEEGERE